MLLLPGSPYNIGQGFTVNADGSVELAKQVPTTTQYGLLSVGKGPWDGTSAGHFIGNVSGTALALAMPNTYAGHYIEAQSSGSTIFYIDHTGGTFIAGFLSLTGQLFAQSAVSVPRRTAAATGAIANTDFTVWGNAAGGAITLTLPAANTCFNGQLVSVTKIDTSANAVTLAANGTDKVNNAASISLAAIGNGGIFQTDAVASWWEIG